MPSTSTPYSKPAATTNRSKSDASLMRDKNGCITCRVRQKKCNGVLEGGAVCGDCKRLNIQCLGVHHNRPDWLRNQDALKETKYLIKHHLTEYPVPRGRGPAPDRPFLSFQDLIDKYSPQRYAPSCSTSPDLKSDRLIRMDSESPTTYTPSMSSNYLSVQTNVYPIHNTPSPSSSYTPMPLTPASSDGSLFMLPDMPVPCGEYPFQTNLGGQPAGATFHEVAYIPDFPEFANIHLQSQSRGPYRHGRDYSQSLFLTSPVESQQYQYDFTNYSAGPSARQQY